MCIRDSSCTITNVSSYKGIRTNRSQGNNKKINTRKASGYDLLSGLIMKPRKDIAFLTSIFNCTLTLNYFFTIPRYVISWNDESKLRLVLFWEFLCAFCNKYLFWLFSLFIIRCVNTYILTLYHPLINYYLLLIFITYIRLQLTWSRVPII